MKNFKKIFIYFLFFYFIFNISTTQTVRTSTNQFPFQFPPGSPFEDMFKEFNRPTERKATALGSGFVIVWFSKS